MSSRVCSWLTHALALSLLICVPQPSAMGQANVQGQWSTLSNTMPINPIHVALLCNGMVLLEDGRPFVVSGTIQYDPLLGQLQAATFDPVANTFSNTPNMAH